jgi:hypothetical protein
MGNNKVETVAVETVRGNETEEDAGSEEGNMESLMSSFRDGEGSDDDFVTAEEKEARAALDRRLKRKRRLENLEASADATIDADADTDTSTNKAKIRTKNEYLPISAETIEKPVVKEDQSLVIGTEKNANADDDPSENGGSDEENGSDSDDSDMFGSPSSEDRAHKKKQRKKENSKDNNNSNNKNKHSSKDDDEHKKKTGANSRQDGFDDSDGYYKASIGETMELEVLGGSPSLDESQHESETSTLKLRVLGVIGKGVFSSVLKCSTTTTTTAHGNGIPTTISLASSNPGPTNGKTNNIHGLPSEVAIKCIRSNETMSKAALDEMKFLIRLRNSPGIVPLLLPSPAAQNNTVTNPNYVPPPIDFKGHTVLVFPYLPYNLRDVLQKFGKGVGLSLTAVKNYYFQLLSAATHLQKHRVIHADIKPDNILVTSDFSKVVLADFGSAFESRAAVVQNDEAEGDDAAGGGAAAAAVAASAAGRAATHEAVTPYLVSRFYRAPEIIMGLQPLTHAIDLWSFAVTAAELFLGKVLLKGASNNNMLYVMMEMLVSSSSSSSSGVLFSY